MSESPPNALGPAPGSGDLGGAPAATPEASGPGPACEVDAAASPDGAPRAGRIVIRPVGGRWVGLASWGYTAAVLAALGLIHLAGNRWWLATIVLFSPRWLFLVPIALLALAGRGRYWAVQLATILVVAGPLMQANVPLARLNDRPPAGERLAIVTYNLGTEKVDLPRLRKWLDARQVSVVCFQEGPRRREPEFLEGLGPGWHFAGICSIASRHPIVEEIQSVHASTAPNGRGRAVLARVRVRLPSGREIVVASAHLPTLRPGFEGLPRQGTRSIDDQSAWWEGQMQWTLDQLALSYEVPTIVGGDFNMPSDSPTMTALHGSFRLAFEDAGWGYGYTYPTRSPWTRIDHVLAGPEWQVASCRVGPDFGSDHLPLLAELVLTPVSPARD